MRQGEMHPFMPQPVPHEFRTRNGPVASSPPPPSPRGRPAFFLRLRHRDVAVLATSALSKLSYTEPEYERIPRGQTTLQLPDVLDDALVGWQYGWPRRVCAASDGFVRNFASTYGHSGS